MSYRLAGFVEHGMEGQRGAFPPPVLAAVLALALSSAIPARAYALSPFQAVSSESVPGVVRGQGQVQILAGPVRDRAAFFGHSIATSGRTLLVGAPFDVPAPYGSQLGSSVHAQAGGRVYVYRDEGSGYVLKETLRLSGARTGDGFGTHVAMDGDLMAVSALRVAGQATERGDAILARGAVHVYSRVSGVWEYQSCLTNPSQDTGSQFGEGLAVAGTTILVGAPNEGGPDASESGWSARSGFGTGAAYVFDLAEGQWDLVTRLAPVDLTAQDQFGAVVALEGGLAAIGAPWVPAEESPVGTDPASPKVLHQAGAVYLFHGRPNAWTAVAKLQSPLPDAWGLFGSAIALNAGRVLVGAYNEDGTRRLRLPGRSAKETRVAGAGNIYLFEEAEDAWGCTQSISAPEPEKWGGFGYELAFNGHTALVSSQHGHSSRARAGNFLHRARGRVLLVSLDLGSSTLPSTFHGLAGEHTDWFGHAVSLGTDRVIVSSPRGNAPGPDRRNPAASGAGVVMVWPLEPSAPK